MINKVDDYAKTILPLDYCRALVCDVDPYHFWQMTYTGHPERGYSHIYPHERWQYTTTPLSMPAASAKRGPGRRDFLDAIAKAEAKISAISELNTWPGPKYTESEEVQLVKPSAFKFAYPTRRTPYGLRTRWWHIQYVGVQRLTPIQAGVALSFDATDNVTLTVTTTVSADEIVITYPGETIQIRPIEVTKVGNLATITLKKWLCGNPTSWETAEPINADVVLNLLQTVDVHRSWVDPSSQITIAWEPDYTLCTCDNSSTCQVCQLATADACALRKDYKVGYVGWQFATWNAVTGVYDSAAVSCSRFPEKAYISYVHGFPTNGDRYISNRWAQAVAILAAAELPDYVYDTTSQPQQLYYWREDFARQEGKSRHTMSMSDLGNPFGTKRGQIEAWKIVKQAIGD